MGGFRKIIDRGLDFMIVGVSSGFLVLLSTATFIEVFTRYIWGFSTSQVSSWCVFFLMWLSFGTMGIALKEKKHIVMGTLGEYLTHSGKIRARLFLDIFLGFTVIIFGIIFSYLGILNVIEAKATGYHTTIDFVPYYWLWFLSLPVGALTLLLYAVRDVIISVGQLIKSRDR